MGEEYDDYEGYEPEPRPADSFEISAVDELRELLTEQAKGVFCAKHLQVRFEDRYFHWVTERALKILREEGVITIESRMLSHGAKINLLWNRSHRYPRRQAAELVSLVEKYSEPEFTAALGQNAELLLSDGLGRFRFDQLGRDTGEYGGRSWTGSEDLDFLFGRDGRVYGIEVKNTLSYMDSDEWQLKVKLCEHIGVIPVFVVRAAPKSWIYELATKGGFTLLMKYQLYPLGHKSLADEVSMKTGLPVRAPRALFDGTVQRFLSWHEARLEQT